MTDAPFKSLGGKTSAVIRAAYCAMKMCTPFALYRLPGKKRVEFIASVEGRKPRSDKRMIIVPWLADMEDGYVIEDTISAADFMKNLPERPSCDMSPEAFPWEKSTDKFVYKGQVMSFIDALDETGYGKIVLSRVICGSLSVSDPELAWIAAFTILSRMNPDTFCYLYFTPKTGCWMAASPELLLDFDKKSRVTRSMALAGTRKRTWSGPLGEWDQKNVYEHDLVLDEICEGLRRLGVEEVGVRERVVEYGEVEHRCHDIRFNSGVLTPEVILNELSPTPALGGFPRELALGQIERYELHPRGCYGGYVMLDTDVVSLAYVNLRCVNFLGEKYCIYTGGGITSESKPEEEWKETELKAKHLLNTIDLSENMARVVLEEIGE